MPLELANLLNFKAAEGHRQTPEVLAKIIGIDNIPDSGKIVMKQSLVQLVGTYLEKRLCQRFTVTYGEVAAAFELAPITDAWQIHPLCKIFEELDVQDARENRPFRTAAVINKSSNRPGQGFFQTLHREGRIRQVPTTEDAMMKVYVAELGAAMEYWETHKQS